MKGDQRELEADAGEHEDDRQRQQAALRRRLRGGRRTGQQGRATRRREPAGGRKGQHRERHERGGQQLHGTRDGSAGAGQRHERDDGQGGELEGDQPGAEVAGRADPDGTARGGEQQGDGHRGAARLAARPSRPGQQQRHGCREQRCELQRGGDPGDRVEAGVALLQAKGPGGPAGVGSQRADVADGSDHQGAQPDRVVQPPGRRHGDVQDEDENRRGGRGEDGQEDGGVDRDHQGPASTMAPDP